MSDRKESSLNRLLQQDNKKKLCNEASAIKVAGSSETDKGARFNKCMLLPEQNIKDFIERHKGKEPNKVADVGSDIIESYAPSVPNSLPRGPKQLG